MIQENKRIFLSSPHMGGEELHYIQAAFDKNYIAPVGENIGLFENAIKNYVGAGHVLGTNSGTSALHLAMIALGVGQGDIVLCQSFTFAASANPIIYQGAIPVFIDSESKTWNMDPNCLEEAIVASLEGKLGTFVKNPDFKNLGPKKPKAIVPVHLYGMPAQMDVIVKIAAKYDIPVIEDAAEALGSKIKGKHCGTFGAMGIYSFNGNKIITTSSGGALVSENESLIAISRKLSTQARDEAIHYEHSMIGFNYRLSNVLAGIGIGQMKVLEERIALRRNNFSFYRELLSPIKEIEFLDEPEGYFSNRWLTTICLHSSAKTKDSLVAYLEKQNIESRPLWKPMHLQPVFKGYPFIGNNTASNLFDIGICLPSGSNLNERELDRISKALLSFFG